MKFAIAILATCLLCLVLHGQIKSGIIKNGSLVNAQARIPNTFVDTFNRADADPMSTNATDDIGVWTDGPGCLFPCKIQLGQLRTSTGLDSGCRVLYPPFRSDQSASIVVGDVASVGLMLRMQSPTVCSGYLAAIDDPTHISIYKVVDTGTIAYTLIGLQATVATINPLDTFTFSIVGSTLDVYVNGASLGLTRTDSANTYTSGQPGAYLYEFGGSIVYFFATDL